MTQTDFVNVVRRIGPGLATAVLSAIAVSGVVFAVVQAALYLVTQVL